mmetsp:Transcript_9875/g.25381  ORF Transcript_9875/g.25381 Transcript_9875/m.25381 type:complete len:661 (-) Transcript_9875:603-2585(-)
MEVDVGFVVLADDGDDESELSSESEDRHPPVLSVGASTDDEAEQGAEAEEEEGEGEGGEDKEPVVSFGMNEEEEVDTTAEQAAQGRDVQGIPWERLQFSRDHYRKTRIISYRNYVNVVPEDPVEFRLEYRPELLKLCTPVAYDVGNGIGGEDGCCSRKGRASRPAYFNFVRNSRAVHTNIVHFQLRNLVWAASRNDVLYVHQNSVYHWSPVSRTRTELVRMSGHGRRSVPLGRVQVSTLSHKDDLIAAGGFNGELVCYRLRGEGELLYAERITNSDNGITNGLEIFSTPQYDLRLVASNNDQAVRVYQAQPSGMRLVNRWDYDWAVNYSTVQPGSPVLAVVGDDPATHLTDMRTGARVSTLAAHADFSFAAAWHPSGQLLATGNQDTTTCVWDVRQPSSPVARMAGNMGAIRSLRFSPDGKYLAAAEPADFVHIYDVASDFKRAQLIDLFGEISGISFTPLGEELFVGVADLTYSSMLQYERAGPASGMGSCQDVPLQWDRQSEADEQDEQDGEVEVSDMEDEEELRWQQLQQSLREEEEQEELDRQQRMEQIDDRVQQQQQEEEMATQQEGNHVLPTPQKQASCVHEAYPLQLESQRFETSSRTSSWRKCSFASAKGDPPARPLCSWLSPSALRSASRTATGNKWGTATSSSLKRQRRT